MYVYIYNSYYSYNNKNSKNNNDNNDNNNNNTTSVQDPHMILKLTKIYGTMTMICGTYLQL